jgi:ABC-type nickel/cobalt efflux system permease component RcnA
MSREILVLAGTAAAMGLVHTLVGPDHYIPFIAMSRARRWRLSKTLFISFLSGLGHILSSVVLGFIGIAFGIAVSRLESAESARGGAAAWLLIAFGFAYFIWGLHRAAKKRPHKHAHIHAGGEVHEHEHGHESEHVHVHDHVRTPRERANITPWILFTIFVFGPCEPLIPLIMYPAAKHSLAGVMLVTAAFGLTTILTMLTVIAVSSWGASFVRLGRFERFSHALAGAMILASGLSVQFLGL